MVTTNDLRVGTRVMFDSGGWGILMDCRKGNKRKVDIGGDLCEVRASSIYSYWDDGVQEWVGVALTRAQLEAKVPVYIGEMGSFLPYGF